MSGFILYRIIYLALASVITLPCFSQNYWAQKAGGATIDEALDISQDGAGNIYLTGYFTSTAVFSSTINISSAGSTDIFLAKYDSQGIPLWAVRAGGNAPDRGLSVKTDNNGNSFITGFFHGTATFGSTTLTSFNGSQDVFIAKYNSAGTLQWAKSAGGVNGDIGYGITTDNAGNVYVTGEFLDTAQFGSFQLISAINPTTLTPSIDAFITKLDALGNFLWLKHGKAKYTDRGMDLAADNAGNIYVTGQYSDTISFDNTYNNNAFNSIFIIKYSDAGNETWFRRIGGGVLNIAYSIAIDAGNNIYITGDMKGNVQFSSSPVSYLNNSFPNAVFVAKYDNSGSLLWASSDGSDNFITARSIALDNASNPYIIGHFKCVLSAYANSYGSGTFNSVGFNDIYISKYNAAGNWQWSKQVGGRKEDYGNGLTVSASGQAIICGSFQERINFPNNSSFTGYAITNNYSGASNSYCSDQNYAQYAGFTSSGNSDIFIGKAIDTDRQPYDYYKRTGTGCQRDYRGVCVNYSCPDSVTFCGSGTLNAITHTDVKTYYPYDGTIGPDFSFKWSNNDTLINTNINSSGVYSVTATTKDGCFVSSDSIKVIVHPFPLQPTISDSKGINNNAVAPLPVYMCAPDSVILTGGNYGADNYYWTGPGLPANGDSILSITADTIGIYYFNVKNSFGCLRTCSVYVYVSNAIVPNMVLLNDSDAIDTADICPGDFFSMLIYDTVSNPDTIPYSCFSGATVTWFAVTNLSTQITNSCPNPALIEEFYPTISGLYNISAKLVIESCDTYLLSKTVYINMLAKPQVNVAGPSLFCPGDTAMLVATGADVYYWFPWYVGNIIGSNANDTAFLNISDIYGVYGTDTISGCKGYTQKTVSTKLQPQVSTSPSNALLCPNDSVLLSVNTAGTYQWFGPLGSIAANTQSIVVNLAGSYYCIVTDADSCTLTSNTKEVKQYATPVLEVAPSWMLCSGDSSVLTVTTNDGSLLQWLPPLSGNSMVKTVYSSGTYSCKVISCGITTTVSATINVANLVAQIQAGGSLNICSGDSVILTVTPGYAQYQWNNNQTAVNLIAVSQTGSFWVTVTDNNGCTTVSDTVNVFVTASPAIPIVSDTVICSGNSISLSAISADTIQWYDASVDGLLLHTGISYNTPVIVNTTTYYVQAVKGICTSPRAKIVVFVSEASLPVNATSNAPLCEGDTLVFSLSKVCNCVYSWTGPGGFIASSAQPKIINVDTMHSGTYYFSVSDSVCTSDTLGLMVFVSPEINLQGLQLTQPLCNGNCNGSAKLIFNGGIAPYKFYWNEDSSFSATDTTLCAGLHKITVVDMYGCKADTVFMLIAPPQLVNSSSVLNENCAKACDGGITSSAGGGTPPYNFSINLAPAGMLTGNLCPGTYNNKVIDDNGCNDTKTVIVEPALFQPLPVSVSVDKDTLYTGEDTKLHASINAPGIITWQPVAYVDNPQSLHPVVNPPVTTTFVFSITDPNNNDCVFSDSVTVTVLSVTCDEPDIFVPNAFTPNDDNQNDIIYVRGPKIKSMRLSVFNELGELIYETENQSKGWDGKFKGSKCGQGVYVYYLKAVCVNGKEFSKKGNITLID